MLTIEITGAADPSVNCRHAFRDRRAAYVFLRIAAGLRRYTGTTVKMPGHPPGSINTSITRIMV